MMVQSQVRKYSLQKMKNKKRRKIMSLAVWKDRSNNNRNMAVHDWLEYDEENNKIKGLC